MNREQAIEAAKEHMEDYLHEMGVLDLRKPFRCLNPSHEDKHPSMSFDSKRNKVRCFTKCGKSYDVLDLIGFELGTEDFNAQLEEACRRFHIDIDSKEKSSGKKPQKREKPAKVETEDPIEEAREEYIKLTQEAFMASNEAKKYLEKRGISADIASSYGVGFTNEFRAGSEKWHALIFPTGKGSYTARNIGGKDRERYRNVGASRSFNLQRAFEDEGRDTIHIVEGEIDALSVIEAGGQAVALGSTSNVRKFCESLKELVKASCRPFEKTLILSLDNDATGEKAQRELYAALLDLKRAEPYSDEKMHELFKGMRVFEVNISLENKDPNEALIAAPEDFRVKVAQRTSDELREEYLQTSAGMRLIAFHDGVEESADTPAISTGYEDLDKQLDGGLYEGLYTIPAISSLGKTTFALQMAEAIAAQGKDVIYFSLEMSASELIAKALSRHSFLIAAEKNIDRSNAKTVRGITDGKRYERYSAAEKDLIMQAYNAYDHYAWHLYIQEGLGNIGAKEVRERVERHILITGNTPVVFIDYLQILSPADPRATDKTNMDKAALEMKRLSRDLKTPVVVVSSVNRLNYHETISLEAIKESGAIEYGSDVVIGLQLEGAGSKEAKANPKEWVNEKKSEEPRGVEAVILKNRNGRSGESVLFDYYARFNLFYERRFHEPYKVYYEAHEK